MAGNNTTDATFQKGSTDERDRKIKNESDKGRLRSERQSVMDKEKDDQAHWLQQDGLKYKQGFWPCLYFAIHHWWWKAINP